VKEEHSLTANLKKLSPVWWWLRKNFTFPAVCVILGVSASAAGYIIHLNTKVVVLEKVIMPMVKAGPDLARLDERVGVMERRWAKVDLQGELPTLPMSPQMPLIKPKANEGTH